MRKISAMEKPENLDDPREAVLKYAKVRYSLEGATETTFLLPWSSYRSSYVRGLAKYCLYV